MDEFIVSEQFLDEALSNNSKCLVGKVCKRFEICSDQEQLKKEIKELIYENYRELKENIKSFCHGVRFVTRPNK